jgi:predicted nucleotidyltransferase
VDEAILYGSCAKGNFKTGSDIDLTLKGANLTLRQLNAIELEFDDSRLPYEFDLSIYAHIENPQLLGHINRVGVVLYKKAAGNSAG